MSGEDKDEVGRILENINENLKFLHRKYGFLEIELEKTSYVTSTKYQLRAYSPREEIRR